MLSSEYIEQQRKAFAVYVLQNRALPTISDGLKTSARRVLWIGRDGSKYKTATLAGATMPIHPHAAPDGVINTLTGIYLNNITLFEGSGAFGSRLAPNAAASSRYTSVKISKFTHDVIFRDIELVEMIDNYDQTLKEPKNFLPLVPIVLLNPTDGIGLGFACSILPRDLGDIIKLQIQHLTGKRLSKIYPSFKPFNTKSTELIIENDKERWVFESGFERLNSFEIKVTSLPYGMSYDKFINSLNKLEESGYIKDYIDASASDINIVIKYPRGYLATTDDQIIKKKLGLISKISENLTILDINGDTVITPTYDTIIKDFTDFRLTYYTKRYNRLLSILDKDIQKYRDILLSIKKKVGHVSTTIEDKSQLEEFLEKIGVVNLDYIASLPVYRFTIKEKEKIELKLSDALKLKTEYEDIISSDSRRVEIYVTELKEIASNYKKGKYTT